MLVGIISDTHDNLPMIDEVVARLNKDGVQLVLHAGDYISPFVPSHFKPLKARLVGVFGNNCAERELLKKRFAEIGAEVKSFFVDIEVDGLKVALLHGHEEALLNSLINSGIYDVLVYGHLHKADVRTVRETLVINPGEVCGYLSGEHTYALLDVERRKAEIIRMAR